MGIEVKLLWDLLEENNKVVRSTWELQEEGVTEVGCLMLLLN